MRYQVEWENTLTGEHNKHGVYDTLDDAVGSVYAWWEENYFSPPYVRAWTKGGVTTLDYGSHHMFYRIIEIFEQQEKYLIESRAKLKESC